MARRQRLFGKNRIALPSITPFHELMANQFEDDNVIKLILAATFYLAFSVLGGLGTVGYMESLTIYSGVFFASFVAALCDWIKERQFLKIKDEINNAQVIVYRGQFGTVNSISVRDLVVGDIIDIQQGDRVPADCVLIEETNITVDQSIYDPKDSNIEKECSYYYPDQEDKKMMDNHAWARNREGKLEPTPDPFLLSASMIMTANMTVNIPINRHVNTNVNKQHVNNVKHKC